MVEQCALVQRFEPRDGHEGFFIANLNCSRRSLWNQARLWSRGALWNQGVLWNRARLWNQGALWSQMGLQNRAWL